MQDNKLSTTVYYSKAFAIFSVICAHCSGVNKEYSYLNQVVSKLLDIVGTLGVGVFFFWAGYFFALNGDGFKSFWQKKITRLFVPWIFTGSIVYLYVYLRKGTLELGQWLKWLVGLDTYLYFMTVLVMCYLIMHKFKRNMGIILLFSLVSVLSIAATNFGILRVTYPYMNPFNFLIYFNYGMIYLKLSEKKSRQVWLQKLGSCMGVFLLLVFVVMSIKLEGITYFRLIYVPIELMAITSIVAYSRRLAERRVNQYLLLVGRWSFSIYLIHMLFVGIVVLFMNKMDNFLLTAMRPFVILVITCIGISIGRAVAKKIDKRNWLLGLVGIKE